MAKAIGRKNNRKMNVLGSKLKQGFRYMGQKGKDVFNFMLPVIGDAVTKTVVKPTVEKLAKQAASGVLSSLGANPAYFPDFS